MANDGSAVLDQSLFGTPGDTQETMEAMETDALGRGQLRDAAAALTGCVREDARLAGGCLVLVDGSGVVRVELPLGYVEAITLDMEQGYHRLEGALRKGIEDSSTNEMDVS